MFGVGVLKGLGVTMKHWIYTYIDDLQKIPSRYAGGREILRQRPDEEGIFTIQYPEERRVIPERFRFIPMLLYDAKTGKERCTACGICSKVCPPQCIWIVRDKDEKGKPITRPAEFYIDVSICMSCGFCAEFCPFDAIRMDHDYELAVYERYPRLIYTKQELMVPLEYYAALYPNQFAAEEEARAAKEKARQARASRQAGAAAKGGGRGKLSPEEIERRRAAAAARRAQRQAKQKPEEESGEQE
ncbi:MAG: 4Fe-4S dicluster domain-containing protein [Chloroflexi bacterium]|nr:4Fe-4S dicluster domain-containing protein [Chloroflexota bacterium]